MARRPYVVKTLKVEVGGENGQELFQFSLRTLKMEVGKENGRVQREFSSRILNHGRRLKCLLQTGT